MTLTVAEFAAQLLLLPLMEAEDADRGYGRVRWNGPLAYAHRVVYELLVGPVLAGQYISKGHRQCRECHRQRGRRYYREARAS